MKNKILLGTAIVATCTLLLGLGALNVAAQTPLNDSPWNAIYTHGEPRPIPAQTTLWFKFEYGGDRKPVSMALFYGRTLGLEFEVYTPEQAEHYWDWNVEPVGRGTAPMVPCDAGRCQSDHLMWKGGFPVGGTYYVAVINPNPQWVTMQLAIAGESVVLGPGVPVEGTPTETPVAVASPTPVVVVLPPLPPIVVTAPTPTPTLVKPENDSPYNARYIRDNRDESITSKTTLWYCFDYGGDRSQIFIVLPNAVNLGLEFRIYTPDQAALYPDGKFVGRGTISRAACEGGRCTTNDLTWQGSFSARGTYYVEVINPTDKEIVFRLHIEGTNIVIAD